MLGGTGTWALARPGPQSPLACALLLWCREHLLLLLLQLGLELTLVGRALSYTSLDDAVDDVAALYRGVSGLVTLPLKAAELLGGDGGGSTAGTQARRREGEA